MVDTGKPIIMEGVIAPTREPNVGLLADSRVDEPTDHLDPAHELYAHAASVLASAQAVDAASHPAGAVAAVAPTLACLETSLTALAAATDRLRGHALTRLSEPLFEADDRRRQRGEVSASLERLAGVLAQASIAAEQALDAIDPVLDDLTL